MQLESNVVLGPLTTLRVGGPAAFFVRVSTIESMVEVAQYAREQSIPTSVLGEGSNVLVPDVGLPGIVIKNEMLGLQFENEGANVLVTVASGEHWDAFVKETVLRGLYGIENLSGIPGTVGATPIQNVGAYGAEVSDVIQWVEVLDSETGHVQKLSKGDCKFGYRDSAWKHPGGKRLIVTRVCFRLSMSGEPNLSYRDLKDYFKGRKMSPTLGEIRNAVLAIRAKKFPDLHMTGTAGSFFKNPILTHEEFTPVHKQYPEIPFFELQNEQYKVPLAWILDHVCHLKNTWQGNVGLFERQPLVLVTKPGATATDVELFARDIAQRVNEMTGIVIQREVTTLS
jgi:UDP-N-acetylmuramate dehydrogenase